jgi:hypothetical protein
MGRIFADQLKVNIFRVAKASDSRRPPPTLDNEIDTLPELVQSPRSAFKLERKTLKIWPSF